MFQVLVVDDEPSAAEYICNIIRLKCPRLTVTATAENGKEGLEKFFQYMPDLVISDVKMPVMDGLEMIKEIKAAKEETSVMLVSGYQEFEYVRAALKYGVSDYILKPMTPSGFAASIKPVIQKMCQRMYEQQKRLARSMIMGEGVDREQMRRCFQEEAYYVAVIRENGLPRRFTDTWELEIISEPENTMFVYGRDDREALYICPEKAVSALGFLKFIEKESSQKIKESNFVTTVMVRAAVSREKLGETVEGIYGEMNGRLSVGVTQTIFMEPSHAREEEEKQKFHRKEIIKNVERCLEKRDFSQFFTELSDVLKEAEEGKYPQLYLEQMTRQILSRTKHFFNGSPDVLEEERMFEDAFYDAGTTGDLLENLKGILSRYWKKDKESVKLDSREFLDEIKKYIDNNLDQELTVPSMCREFHLSQSYLNLIFRKHGMESFNTYLRNARIRKAKEIMDRNPQMFIKDVALMVGYKDQFYFSRIFRAVTGVSPSTYPRG